MLLYNIRSKILLSYFSFHFPNQPSCLVPVFICESLGSISSAAKRRMKRGSPFSAEFGKRKKRSVLGDSQKNCESSPDWRTAPFRIFPNARFGERNFSLRAHVSRRFEKRMDLFPQSDDGIARGGSHEDAEGTDLKILFINNLWRRCSRSSDIHKLRCANAKIGKYFIRQYK